MARMEEVWELVVARGRGFGVGGGEVGLSEGRRGSLVMTGTRRLKLLAELFAGGCLGGEGRREGALACGGLRMNLVAGCEGEGLGTAVLVGFDVGRMCWRAGNVGMERWLAELLDGHTAMTYRCSAGVVTRRRAKGADHYYVLNDGAAGVNARLDVFDAEYARGEELITGRELEAGGTWWFELPAGGAAWLRMERKG